MARKYLATIQEGDIGKQFLDRPDCPTCGSMQKFWINEALGRVHDFDVGKRVYRVGVPGHRFTQVENDDQVAARLAKE